MRDERTVHVSQALGWINLMYDPPYQPWSSVHLVNEGPSDVEISMNYPEVNKFMLTPGKPVRYDTEPIKIVFFRCMPGLRATVKVQGEL